MRTATGDEQTAVTGAPGTAADEPERDPLLDNAKLFAVALVVVGHAIEPLTAMPAARGLYAAIWAFHMPALVLIAGYLSRTFSHQPHQVQRVITSIVVPYAVFEVSYEVLKDLRRGNDINTDILDPSFAMWFLVALLVWRLSAPLWKTLQPAAAVCLALGISLVAGTGDLPDTLDMHRVLGFLPFYVLGLTLPESYFAAIRLRPVRIAAIPTLLGALGCAYLFGQGGGHVWFFYSRSYEDIGVGLWSGLGHRFAALALGFVLLTAFLAAVPRRRTWFTGLGAAPLYAYLLSRYPRKAASSFGLYDHAWLHTLGGLVVTVAAAVALTVLLSSHPVRVLFRPVVEPKLPWLFRRRARGGSHRAS